MSPNHFSLIIILMVFIKLIRRKQMTIIQPEQELITLINTFTVKPSNQDKLVKLLKEAAEDVMKHMDEFISY